MFACFVQERGGCRLHIPPSGTTGTVMIHLHCPVEQHMKNKDASFIFFCNVPSINPLISTHSLTERPCGKRGALGVGHMKKHYLFIIYALCFHWTEDVRNKEETQAKASPTQREQILQRSTGMKWTENRYVCFYFDI